MESDRMIRTGTEVRVQRKDTAVVATVIAIERCPRRGDKYGQPVRELAWRDRETAFITLADGYCYGYELV